MLIALILTGFSSASWGDKITSEIKKAIKQTNAEYEQALLEVEENLEALEKKLREAKLTASLAGGATEEVEKIEEEIEAHELRIEELEEEQEARVAALKGQLKEYRSSKGQGAESATSLDEYKARLAESSQGSDMGARISAMNQATESHAIGGGDSKSLYRTYQGDGSKPAWMSGSSGGGGGGSSSSGKAEAEAPAQPAVATAPTARRGGGGGGGDDDDDYDDDEEDRDPPQQVFRDPVLGGTGGGITRNPDGTIVINDTFVPDDTIIKSDTADMGGGITRNPDGTITIRDSFPPSDKPTSVDDGRVMGRAPDRPGTIVKSDTADMGGGLTRNPDGTIIIRDTFPGSDKPQANDNLRPVPRVFDRDRVLITRPDGTTYIGSSKNVPPGHTVGGKPTARHGEEVIIKSQPGTRFDDDRVVITRPDGSTYIGSANNVPPGHTIGRKPTARHGEEVIVINDTFVPRHGEEIIKPQVMTEAKTPRHGEEVIIKPQPGTRFDDDRVVITRPDGSTYIGSANNVPPGHTIGTKGANLPGRHGEEVTVINDKFPDARHGEERIKPVSESIYQDPGYGANQPSGPKDVYQDPGYGANAPQGPKDVYQDPGFTAMGGSQPVLVERSASLPGKPELLRGGRVGDVGGSASPGSLQPASTAQGGQGVILDGEKHPVGLPEEGERTWEVDEVTRGPAQTIIPTDGGDDVRLVPPSLIGPNGEVIPKGGEPVAPKDEGKVQQLMDDFDLTRAEAERVADHIPDGGIHPDRAGRHRELWVALGIDPEKAEGMMQELINRWHEEQEAVDPFEAAEAGMPLPTTPGEGWDVTDPGAIWNPGTATDAGDDPSLWNTLQQERNTANQADRTDSQAQAARDNGGAEISGTTIPVSDPGGGFVDSVLGGINSGLEGMNVDTTDSSGHDDSGSSSSSGSAVAPPAVAPPAAPAVSSSPTKKKKKKKKKKSSGGSRRGGSRHGGGGGCA